MNILRFNGWHILIIFIIAFAGGFRVENLYYSSRDNLNKARQLLYALEVYGVLRDIRFKVAACYNSQGDYDNCYEAIDIEEYNNLENSHFDYRWAFRRRNNFAISGMRNKLDGGNPEDTILIQQKSGIITREGTGLYAFIY